MIGWHVPNYLIMIQSSRIQLSYVKVGAPMATIIAWNTIIEHVQIILEIDIVIYWASF